MAAALLTWLWPQPQHQRDRRPALIGGVLGIAVGHLLTEVLGYALKAAQQVSVTGLIWIHTEWVVLALAVGKRLEIAAVRRPMGIERFAERREIAVGAVSLHDQEPVQRHVRLAVLDRDQTATSRDYTLAISGSRYFVEKPPIADHAELDRRMRAGELALAIEIPSGFGRDLARGPWGALLCGHRSSHPPPQRRQFRPSEA